MMELDSFEAVRRFFGLYFEISQATNYWRASDTCRYLVPEPFQRGTFQGRRKHRSTTSGRVDSARVRRHPLGAVVWCPWAVEGCVVLLCNCVVHYRRVATAALLLICVARHRRIVQPRDAATCLMRSRAESSDSFLGYFGTHTDQVCFRSLLRVDGKVRDCG